MSSKRPWRFSNRYYVQMGNHIKAKINKQNYSVIPEKKYYDAKLKCLDCYEAFIFSAKEQQYWYETRYFWIDSVPNECFACRKRKRQANHIRVKINILLKDKANVKKKQSEILRLTAALITNNINISEKTIARINSALNMIKPKNIIELKKSLRQRCHSRSHR